MNIGLINIEPKIQNTAYMQIAYHHRQMGDTVRLLATGRDLGQYDTLYCSSLFDFTDKSNVPENAVCGGTGYDLTTKLPFDCDLDYSLYPDCDCSYIWLSRGCVRKCGFCVVHDKEGMIKAVKPKNLNPNGKYIQVQDNNFFASPEWRKSLWWLWETNQPLDFQGVDARLLTLDMADALKYTRFYKQLKIAWDNPNDDLKDNIKLLLKKVRPSNVMCYVLIGYDSTHEQNIYRVRKLQEFGITVYVMCIDRKDAYQKKFQKWVNSFTYNKKNPEVSFEEFDPNFKTKPAPAQARAGG